MTRSIPEGYRTLTPSFTFKDSRKAIEFYTRAFGAKEAEIFPNPDGKGTMHATLKIGDCIVMMGDECPPSKDCQDCPQSAETMKGSPISLFIYVSDVDAAFKQAISAGATETMPVADMFWGDRCGSVKDPFGYTWMIATHTHDLTKEETARGAEAFFAKIPKK